MNTPSEYQFGVSKIRISKQEAERRDEIARRFGGTFVGPVSIPGDGLRSWFAIPNRGEQFNARTANEIIEACGLLSVSAIE